MFSSFWHQVRTLIATRYINLVTDQWINIFCIHKGFKEEFGKLYEDALIKLFFRLVLCCTIITIIALL